MSGKLKISDFTHRENNYVSDGKSYRVVDLIKASEGLEVFEIPIKAIYTGNKPWGNSIYDYVFHITRIQQADLKYPIILDTEGWVCDGWHRIAKSILDGKESIKAVRLNVMPEPESNA